MSPEKAFAMDAAYEATERQFNRARLLELGAAKMLQDGCGSDELITVHEALGESIQIRRENEAVRDGIKKKYMDEEPKRRSRTPKARIQ